MMGVAGLVLLAFAVAARASGSLTGLILPASLWAASLLLSVVSSVYTTRRGKFEVWTERLQSLQLKGDEHIVDLGCGRGGVLLLAAKLLPHGQAVGVDLWKSSDQSGNDVEVTRTNAVLEEVAAQVQSETADMRKLPFADASFDLAVSSVAIHNISAAEGAPPHSRKR